MQSIKQVLFFSPSPSPSIVEFHQINISNSERKSHAVSYWGPTILGQKDPKPNAQVHCFPGAYPRSTMEGRCLLCWHVPADKVLCTGIQLNIIQSDKKSLGNLNFIKFTTERKFTQDLAYLIVEMLGFSKTTVILRKPNMF